MNFETMRCVLSEMVERVARAICRKRAGTPQMGTTRLDGKALDAYVQANWRWCQDEARVAIEAFPIDALRQTVDALEMLRRGHGAEVSAACYPALNSGRYAIAMIDEALKP